MRTLLSHPRPSGHVLLARLPHGATFTAQFLDEAAARDITDMAADLILSAALDVAEQVDAPRPEPQEQVDVAHVSYQAPLLPAQMGEPSSFTWMHVPTGQAGDLPAEQILDLLVHGIVLALTAGVANEAADVPDDTSTLT